MVPARSRGPRRGLRSQTLNPSGVRGIGVINRGGADGAGPSTRGIDSFGSLDPPMRRLRIGRPVRVRRCSVVRLRWVSDPQAVDPNGFGGPGEADRIGLRERPSIERYELDGFPRG
jgi:hypothetical protein